MGRIQRKVRYRYGQQVSCDAYLLPRSHIGSTNATIRPAKAKPLAINNIGGS
jgi:hypothetical protein